MRILLTSVGRRGYLVKYFKDALGPNGQVWGGDFNKYAPAFHYCDHCIITPKIDNANYIDQLIRICRKNQINMIVPLIDPELEILSKHQARFDNVGILVVVSPPETVRITYDKYLTYQFGKENGIDVPLTVISLPEAEELISRRRLTWPVVVKPRKGSASANITYCHNLQQLQTAFDSCPEPMIQEFLQGEEYGYDIFSDQNYRPISVFCKRKISMRAGETDQALSTSDQKLIDLGFKIARNMKLFGPMDVDVKLNRQIPKLLEMNPRFGGGYPCSHLAGADFPAKLISLYHKETLVPEKNSCPDGVYMLKQDEIISPTQPNLDDIENWE